MQINTDITPSIRKKWTKEELTSLQDLYCIKGMGAKEISKLLNRSKTSVWVKIKRLRFRHTANQTFAIKSKLRKGQNNPMYGKKSWCNGLRKNTSDIIKNKAKKQSTTRKNMFMNGELNLNGQNNPMFGKPSWCKGLTKENNDILKQIGIKSSIARKREWLNMSEEKKEKIRKHCAIIGSKCKKKKTSIEIKVEKLLNQYGISHIDNHYMGGFTFDFYLTETKSVIECQGDYWHCNPRKYKTSNINQIQQKNIIRDNKKLSYLNDNKIPYLFLWEYDIKNNFENVKLLVETFIKYEGHYNE